MSNQLFPDVKIIFGFADGCHWCDRFKRDTLPMVRGLGLRYQVITEDKHLEKYDAGRYGFPFIAVCDSKGYPLKKHGGHMLISELLEFIGEVYDEHFPDNQRNRSIS